MNAANPLVGTWTYRSLLNDPDIDQGFDKLEFGRGTLVIDEAAPAILSGTIGGPGWSLALHGSFGFGSPMQARFQGKGLVNGQSALYVCRNMSCEAPVTDPEQVALRDF